MIRRRPTRIVALILLASWLAGRDAGAGLTLTSAATQAGFGLSVFASGFPSQTTSFGAIGPLGVAFTNTGSVLVSDDLGNVRLFATDRDGQNAATTPVSQNYGLGNAGGLAQIGGNIYMTQQANNDLVQINANGTFNQTIVGITFATGLVADPANGHLFVSTDDVAKTIFDVDPIAKTSTAFATGGFDGLTISSDGRILYAANYNGHIFGFDTATKAQVFDSGFIPGGIDGVALGAGSLLGNIFVSTNSGTVYEVNLATMASTLIASGGSRGDFVTADPNGSLLLTQSDSISRLIAPPGGSFGPVPEPSSLFLVGLGCLGLSIYSRCRTRRGKSH